MRRERRGLGRRGFVAGVGRRSFVAGLGLGAGAGILAAGPRRAFAFVIDPPRAMPLARSLCGLGGGAKGRVISVHPLAD